MGVPEERRIGAAFALDASKVGAGRAVYKHGGKNELRRGAYDAISER